MTRSAGMTKRPKVSPRKMLQVPWTAAELKLLGTVPDEVLARRLGRSRNEVQVKRIARRMPVVCGPHNKRWTREEDSLLGTIADGELARRLKRSVAAVGARRRAFGIANKFSKRREWTPAEEAELLSMASDEEFARQASRNTQAVTARRRQLERRRWASITSPLKARAFEAACGGREAGICQ